MQRILVIKLGALGDFIHAFHAFAAIRAHHRADNVTLLTTAPYAAIAAKSPWFDAVLTEPRAPWWNVPATLRVARLIGRYDFVYDLQTSRRSARYFALAGRPPWSGIAPGSSHPHANPDRDAMHTLARQREQLQMAGVQAFPVPERAWLTDGVAVPDLPRPAVLLVPGGAGVGSIKRWPSDRYAELARRLADTGHHPVIIGGPAETEMAAVIRRACPTAIDLTGKTSIPALAALAAKATYVVGNDTGPLQVLSAFGAPTLALFSPGSDQQQAGPRGPEGRPQAVLAADPLSALSVDTVLATLKGAFASSTLSFNGTLAPSPASGRGPE